MQGTSPGDVTYHFSRPQRFARWGLFFEHDMRTYKTLVDFRQFTSARMWDARNGFRSVIFVFNSMSDEALNTFMCEYHVQRLEIDEDIEDKAGFHFAAGAALANMIRGRK